MVLFCLAACRFSGRDYPNIEVVLVNFTKSVMNDEKYSTFVQSQSYPAIFLLTVFLILDRQHVEVKKNLGSALETDFMVT